nr:amidohydrolase [Sedimentibacter sp.]
MEKSDISLILYNGTIYSMESEKYNWVAIKDGKIYKTGYRDEYIELLQHSKMNINLNNKIVLPGFYDCHVHLVQTGISMILGVDLSNETTINGVLERIKNKADNTAEGQLIQGIHYNISNIKENRFPTRKELDKVSPENPVWINSIEFHTSALNSVALLQMNMPYDIEGIPRDDNNIPLGILTGKASAYVKNKISSKFDDKLRGKAVRTALDAAKSKGVTTIHAMEGGYKFSKLDAEYVKNNKNKFEQDIILYYQSIDINNAVKNNLQRLGGDVFIDGSFASKTAAIKKPYKKDKGNYGNLYYSQQELNNFAAEAQKNNIQITLHAIGDRAIDQVLTAYEFAAEKVGGINLRNRIEHFELASDDQIKRCKKLNIIPSMQPIFEYVWGGKGGLYEKRLSKSYYENSNRFRKIIDEGIMIIGGSDSDVCEINPILGIYSAVNHPKPKSSISCFEAVQMYTSSAAYASNEENIKGTIKNGKMADLVILDRDIFEINKEDIKDARVCMTVKEGNIIYSDENCCSPEVMNIE